MKLQKCQIKEADLATAKYEMFNNVDPLVQKRMMCLRMRSAELEYSVISSVLGCCVNTVYNYMKLYKEGGIDALRGTNYHHPESALKAHQPTVESSFRAAPPLSVKEAAARIELLTGVKRSPNRVRIFMRNIGMKPIKMGQIPAKANVEEQQKFHEQDMVPLLKQAEKGKCHVLFMDSVHFVLAAFVAVVWCFERLFLKGAPGRFRLNLIGAVHATTKDFMGLYNDTYINAQSVVQLLNRIAQKYAGKPIHIFLDNARYQHCKLVKQTAIELGITLHFLPPYSPNLNLIERLWKFIKAEVLAARYFPDKDSFKKSILDFVNKLNSLDFKKQLKSRLSLNFQLFSHSQKLAV